jgi:hypothetical protein
MGPIVAPHGSASGALAWEDLPLFMRAMKGVLSWITGKLTVVKFLTASLGPTAAIVCGRISVEMLPRPHRGTVCTRGFTAQPLIVVVAMKIAQSFPRAAPRSASMS